MSSGETCRGDPGGRPLEFLHLGLAAKYQLITALARLRERGDREAVGEGFAAYTGRKQPLTPGFAVPSPLGEGCYQLRTCCECKMYKLEGATLVVARVGFSTKKGQMAKVKRRSVYHI